MKDVNSLRKALKTTSKKKENTLEEFLKNLEKPADDLIDACEAALLEYEIPEDAIEVCIYFKEIGKNFSYFKKANVITEKRSIEQLAEKSTAMPNYATYLPLKFVVEKCRKVPFSGRKKLERKEFLYFSEVLKKRGLHSCIVCGYGEVFFAVVFKV